MSAPNPAKGFTALRLIGIRDDGRQFKVDIPLGQVTDLTNGIEGPPGNLVWNDLRNALLSLGMFSTCSCRYDAPCLTHIQALGQEWARKYTRTVAPGKDRIPQ